MIYIRHKDTFYIGPSYFDSFKRFQKASMSIQAPMGAEVDMEKWKTPSPTFSKPEKPSGIIVWRLLHLEMNPTGILRHRMQ